MVAVGKMQGGLHRVEVVADVSTEVGGVVGIDRRTQTTLQEARQRMVGEGVDDPQSHVRQRAHGQWDTLGCQPGHEAIVLDAAHPMIDAFDVENVERLPDVVGRAFLPRVRTANPSARARLYTSLNFTGGLPVSPESSPTPMMCSWYGGARPRASLIASDSEDAGGSTG